MKIDIKRILINDLDNIICIYRIRIAQKKNIMWRLIVAAKEVRQLK